MSSNESLFFQPGKKLAYLIDPDKVESSQYLVDNLALAAELSVDALFVGGSQLLSSFEECLQTIKQHTSLPVWIFPGSIYQISPYADGLLMLSLLSGRNPDYLIGNHVTAAPLIRRSGLATLSTGYLLIEGGQYSSVEYVSQTRPIPRHKVDIALATAMAAELLNMQLLYLEAGSGAQYPVTTEMISAIRNQVTMPLLVGGGLKTPEQIHGALTAGADMVVVGNILEQHPERLRELMQVVKSFNK